MMFSTSGSSKDEKNGIAMRDRIEHAGDAAGRLVESRVAGPGRAARPAVPHPVHGG